MSGDGRKREGLSLQTYINKSPVTGELYAIVLIPLDDKRWEVGQKVYAAILDGWKRP